MEGRNIKNTVYILFSLAVSIQKCCWEKIIYHETPLSCDSMFHEYKQSYAMPAILCRPLSNRQLTYGELQTRISASGKTSLPVGNLRNTGSSLGQKDSEEGG